MADFTIFDTDILIDAGRGVSEAVARLQAAEQQSALAASVITQMELFKCDYADGAFHRLP